MKSNKKLLSAIAAISLLSCVMPVSSCFATSEAATTTAAVQSESVVTETTAASVDEDSVEETTSVDWNALKDEYNKAVQSGSELPDYYDDPYYDTDGNASLIDSKEYKVIYSSQELLFTAVTTKDGHVFYVIVDYSDTDGDNVYFLNKVDDYDLYALMSEDTSDSGAEAPDSNPSRQSSAAKSVRKTSETTVSAVDEADTAVNRGPNKVRLFIALAAVILLGVGAFVIPKLMNSRKRTPVFEDDELEEVSDDE